MKKKGIFENIMDTLTLWGAVQDSKDERGKPDPYKATGLAWALNGELSTEELLELGGYLFVEGAFDDAPVKSSTYTPPANSSPSSTQRGVTPEQERRSMDWNAISDEEKQRRIDKASSTKSFYRYLAASWHYQEILEKLPPTETAEKVWMTVQNKWGKLPNCDPEYQKKFASWLRKNHDIRMDAEGKMHVIKRKKKTT